MNSKEIVKSIYVHFPFCRSKCDYCSFYSSVFIEETANEYLLSLQDEIDKKKCLFNIDNIETLYVGGGTPSLNIGILASILNLITSSFTLSSTIEFTVECNPVDINEQLIVLLKKYKCNRVSLGIQSFDDNTLVYSNRRKQTFEIIENSLELLNMHGFNISIDLINGLPIQKYNKEMDKLEYIIKEFDNINHISLYDLQIESGSRLYNLSQLNLPGEDELDLYEKQFKQITRKQGFVQYEISNYSKRDYHSLHNLRYWKYQNYLGFGPSAHSTIGNTRLENQPDIDLYINKDCYTELYELSKLQQIEEYILMGFRLVEGLNLIQFEDKFGIDFHTLFSNTLKENSDYFVTIDNYIKIKDKHLRFLNKILINFFCDLDIKKGVLI